jgi:hypothetical protein
MGAVALIVKKSRLDRGMPQSARNPQRIHRDSEFSQILGEGVIGIEADLGRQISKLSPVCPFFGET